MNDDNSVNDSNHTVGIKPDTGLGDQLVLALHLVATKAMLAAIRKY